MKETFVKYLKLFKKCLLYYLLALSVSLSIKECEIQPTLINLHPNNTMKNYTNIHLQLDKTDVLGVAILLMTCLIKYIFQIKEKI